MHYLVIGTSPCGGDIFFSKKTHAYLFGAIGELAAIASEKSEYNYKIDLKIMNGELLITDNQDNLLETYKIYQAEETM